MLHLHNSMAPHVLDCNLLWCDEVISDVNFVL